MIWNGKKMKTIALMTLKNEQWIIDTTFPILKKITDNIIVANNNSTDNSLEMLQKYSVDIISNNNTTPSNTVRWNLLDRAREKYGTGNLIMCIDADEFLPPSLFLKNKKNFLSQTPGTTFSSPWVQVWRKTNQYRADQSVWSPKSNFKPFMFLDDGEIDYDRTPLIIDHISRIPKSNINVSLNLDIPLMHLQFVNWKRSQYKQLWYQCIEIINGMDAEEVNDRYKHSSDEENIKYKRLKKKWTKGVELSPTIETSQNHEIWYIKEIETLISNFGIKHFQNLNILNSELIKNFLVNLEIKNN